MFGTSPFSSAPFADIGTEEYELSAGALDAGVVAVSTTTMSEEETLATQGELRTGNPTLGTSDFNQGQTLSAANVDTGSVSVPDISMSEDETFAATGLVTGNPSLDTTVIVVNHALGTTVALATGNPTLGTSDFAQDHEIDTGELATGNVSVPDATMQEEETLGGTGIDTGNPVTDTADITENNDLSTGDLDTGSVSVSDATMFEDETFAATELATGSLSLDTSDFNQTQTFEFVDLETGDVSVPDISMSEEETLSAQLMVINDPETPSADFTQGHNLGSVTLVTDAVSVPDATMFEDETFTTANLNTGALVLGTDRVYQVHILGQADNINTGMRQVDAAFFTQDHILSNDDLSSQPPVIDETEIEGDHKFEPPDIVLVGHNLEEVYFNPDFAREVNADNKKIGNRATFSGGNRAKFGRTAGNRVKVG